MALTYHIYEASGGDDTFTVPPGTPTSITVTAIGAGGSGDTFGVGGGGGECATALVAVSAGQEIWITFGTEVQAEHETLGIVVIANPGADGSAGGAGGTAGTGDTTWDGGAADPGPDGGGGGAAGEGNTGGNASGSTGGTGGSGESANTTGGDGGNAANNGNIPGGGGGGDSTSPGTGAGGRVVFHYSADIFILLNRAAQMMRKNKRIRYKPTRPGPKQRRTLRTPGAIFAAADYYVPGHSTSAAAAVVPGAKAATTQTPAT